MSKECDVEMCIECEMCYECEEVMSRCAMSELVDTNEYVSVLDTYSLMSHHM